MLIAELERLMTGVPLELPTGKADRMIAPTSPSEKNEAHLLKLRGNLFRLRFVPSNECSHGI